MKSAYELAMERLAKESPQESITDQQKQDIAEIEKKYSSKIAEREVFLKSKIQEAISTGELEEAQQLEEELSREIRSLKSSSESEKNTVRDSG
ncbi:hypothetical protein OAK16_04260 [Verrucomicrobia bacterium]|nr:hypothetical protein [Verrucomicrobiota bacterium]